MSQSLHTDEQLHLRQTILAKCVWSDAYTSIQQILKRTDNQLPLLVSFSKNETILFFDRNVSNKLLFTPLRQTEDPRRQFDVHPPHCTFAATELFKGLFEFVREGQRCARVFSNLEQLVDFTTEKNCAVLFMSRDRVKGYFPESNSSKWTSKEYNQGTLFRAERIHRRSEHRKTNNDYLECLDEEGYNVFLKMSHVGRYSLIANSIDQQKVSPEIYLHSTQTSNIGQLIKRVNSASKNENSCIRLVRGPVPYNFHCQYLRLVRQHTYDVLVGLTSENLVIEWNLDSEATCRFATNLNDILNRLSGTWEEQLLETYIDDARRHYRESFQFDMQLISTSDWTAFVQYWKWTGDFRKSQGDEQEIPYQSRQRFHLVASIQDLTDDAEIFINELKRSSKDQLTPPPMTKENDAESEKGLTTKQKDFLHHISKSIESNTVKAKAHRISLQNPPAPNLLITPNASPFDNSTYDSNSHSSLPINQISIHFHKKNARRTQ